MERHERFSWAAELLDIKANDHILEIGCGVGFAVEAITPRLTSGKIIGIDRSGTAIAKAIDRNQKTIASGTATFVNTALLTFSSPGIKYDKIFCFNINLFWTQKSISHEMRVIRSHLKKKGSLYVLYGPMAAGNFEKISTLVAENLGKEKFKIVKVVMDDPLNCCCFIATPA